MPTCKVDEAVMSAILQSGVAVLSEWDMTDWTLTKSEDGKSLAIDSVTIEKKGETRTLTCDALFNFYERTIDPSMFLGNNSAIRLLPSPGEMPLKSIMSNEDLFASFSSVLSRRSRFRRLAGYRSGVPYERSVYFRGRHRDQVLQKVLRRLLAAQVLQ